MKSKQEIKNSLRQILEKVKLLEASYHKSFDFISANNYLEYDKELNLRKSLFAELSSSLNLVSITYYNKNDNEIKELIEQIISNLKNLITLKDNHLKKINSLRDEIKTKLKTIRSAKLIIKNYSNKGDNLPKIFDRKK